MSTINLTDTQMDILSEMANIGCNSALTALGKLLKRETRVSSTNVKFLSLSQVSQFSSIEILERPVELSIVAAASVAGDLRGSLLINFPKDTAVLITSFMTKKNGLLGPRQVIRKEFFDLKVLQKVAGVLTQKYVESVQKFADLDIYVSSDSFMSTTYGRSIIDVIMSTTGLDVKGTLLVVTDAGSYILGHREKKRKILFTLGVTFTLGMTSTLRLLEKMERKISLSGRC